LAYPVKFNESKIISCAPSNRTVAGEETPFRVAVFPISDLKVIVLRELAPFI